jgi:hypothetical protein
MSEDQRDVSANNRDDHLCNNDEITRQWYNLPE